MTKPATMNREKGVQALYSYARFPHTICSSDPLEVITTTYISSMFLEVIITTHDSEYEK